MTSLGVFLAATGLALGMSTPAGAQPAAQSAAITAASTTSVTAELNSKVDTKNAQVGQQVTAETRQSAKLADGTILPKRTRLVGHVTQVQAYQKGHAGSTLAMTFDHAVLKNGQAMPLHSVLRNVAPPADTPDPSDNTAARIAADSVSTPAGFHGGIGLDAAAVNAVSAPPPDMGALANNTPANIAVGARATALPGVMLSAASSGSGGSGVLSAAGKNVSLESGTQITLGLSAQ